MRTGIHILVALGFVAVISLPCLCQSNPRLRTFFERDIGLTEDQISAIRNGEPVAKALPSRTPDEVFLFGAVYIHAAPEAYVEYSHDFERLRKLPGYLGLGVIGNPARLSDFGDFSLDADDIQALKDCKPGNCLIQAPSSGIEDVQRSVDWSASDVTRQVNNLVHERALQLLLAYQKQGNEALGIYSDKRDPTIVPQQFAYMLSYAKALPEYLPDFYRYLLDYPSARPSNVEDAFYWANVKFGLKPTLRIVHVVTMRGKPTDDVAYAIAEKQLYASHYFETALDLSFCVRGTDEPAHRGFYLVMVMGSEQAGLTGFKGSIVRKTAMGRSISNLRSALATVKAALESE